MATNPNIFNPANKVIAEDIKTELRLQGHYLTGALEASLHEKEIHENGGITLTAQALEYIEDLEKGIPGFRIGLDDKSISEMTRYVQLRLGYQGKKAIKVAIAILKKQQKEGNPTKGSYAFTQTGFRTEAVSDTFDKHQAKYIAMIDEPAIGSLDNIFHEIKSGTI